MKYDKKLLDKPCWRHLPMQVKEVFARLATFCRQRKIPWKSDTAAIRINLNCEMYVRAGGAGRIWSAPVMGNKWAFQIGTDEIKADREDAFQAIISRLAHEQVLHKEWKLRGLEEQIEQTKHNCYDAVELLTKEKA